MRAFELQRSERVALCAIIAIALLLRFFRLAHQSLWVDEILSYKAFASVAGVPYWKKFLYDVHGPLYSLVMHFWSAVSESDFWLRTPSALAGTLAVYALFRWFAEIGRRDLAIPAALFMALSPFHVYYSQEMRFYAFLSLFAVLALIAFERFRAAPTARSGALLGVAFAGACLSHFSALFLGAAFLVYLVCSGRMKGAHLRFGALAAAIALVMISPWIYREIWFLRQIHIVDISTLAVEERLRGELTLSRWSYPYALYAFSSGYSLGPGLRELHLVTTATGLFAKHALAIAATGIIFGSLLASGIVRSARRGHLGLFLAVILVTVLSATVVTAYNIKVFNVRYLMCAFPLYIALVAYGLPSGRRARLIAGAAVCAIMLASDGNYFFNSRYAREDVRDAVKVVMRSEEGGDLIIAPAVEAVFAHYYRGRNTIRFIDPSDLGEARMNEEIARDFASHPRVWYLRSRSWYEDPDDILLRSLPAHGDVALRWNAPGVDLILYTKRTR
ncbi:MAG: glycosyltransferase family 39 protein [Candidatus Krumholzibacteria bacterium]|nr:glycosyltransferase family 39 protein [Candidatus Krumholzibacteria bacterium]